MASVPSSTNPDRQLTAAKIAKRVFYVNDASAAIDLRTVHLSSLTGAICLTVNLIRSSHFGDI